MDRMDRRMSNAPMDGKDRIDRWIDRWMDGEMDGIRMRHRRRAGALLSIAGAREVETNRAACAALCCASGWCAAIVEKRREIKKQQQQRRWKKHRRKSKEIRNTTINKRDGAKCWSMRVWLGGVNVEEK